MKSQNTFLDKHLITAHGHMKGRGLEKKASTCCEVFLRKGKGAKGMSA